MVWYPPRQQTAGGGTPMASIPSRPGVNFNTQSSNNNGGNSSSSHINYGNMSNGAGSYHGAATGPGNAMGNQGQAGPGMQSEAMNGLVYPALHLHPLNDTFAPKQISLSPPGPQNRVKIGRQTNVKTMPHPSNGYFDSKVLSRMHAEVWCQDGKMFIRDVKSSNGTFINGERLSPEGQESEVFELHSEDVVEFGIDIVSDDSKTIVHHKVAGRVYLVMTAEDALGIRQDFANIYRGNNNQSGVSGPGMGPGAEGGLRRGKSNVSFDHIIGRLQLELQKTREEGQDISNLSTTVSEINENMDGGIPPMSEAPYQHLVPPLPQDRAKPGDAGEETAANAKTSDETVAALQAQLSETQSTISTQVDRIRALESVFADHAALRAELGTMRSQMEETKREINEITYERRSSSQSPSSQGVAPTLSQLRARDGVNGHSDATAEDDDFDDGASMVSAATITPGADVGSAPMGTDEVESEELENDGHVGPRAPPDLPPELAAKDAADVAAQRASSPRRSASSLSSSAEEQLQAQNRALGTRLEALETQLEEALSFGRTLQSQHVLATETVKALESRVESLEAEMKGQSKTHEELITKALEGRFSKWKEQIEADWKAERKDWETERDNLKKVIEAWDAANGKLEEQAAHQIALGEATGSNGESSRRGSTGPEGKQGGAAGLSSGASSSSSSSRRRASRSAKRRQTKRHLNPSLRALLYKDSHNDPLEDDGVQSSEDEEGHSHSSKGPHAGGLASYGSAATSRESGATLQPKRGDPSQPAGASNASDWLGDQNALRRSKAVGYAFDHPAHSVSALSAFAVLVGVAAWAALGKEAGH